MCAGLNEEQLLQSVRDKAFRLLMRREHSRHELRQKLVRLAGNDLVERLLDDLVRDGIQSDQRFAEMLCRARFNAGKGPVRLKYELSQHRIDADIIHQAISPYDDQWADSARRVRQKKFGRRAIKSHQEWAIQARFLQQRGFRVDHFGSFTEE